MTNFIDKFRETGNISFDGMREVAKMLLPPDRNKCNQLHTDLDRGKGILDDEDHLNMYLFSFGNMHKAKLNEAFDSLPVADIFAAEVEIYDWGCGQGTATVCLLDYLAAKHINAQIKCVNLIEPSPTAIGRANQVISCFNSSYIVKRICRDIDSLVPEDFHFTDTRKIHLFSNILDIEQFDLAKFIHLFQQVFGCDNYIACVGPYYSNSRRMDDFEAAINPDEIYASFDKDRGSWQQDWTISLRAFSRHFACVETADDIRKRIESSYLQDQFFAGYILDAVSEEYSGTPFAETAEKLYETLSVFDVKSNVPLQRNYNPESKLAVLANIIQRGLPTKCPLQVEDLFSRIFRVSTLTETFGAIRYASTNIISAHEIFEALHVIDPRFDVDSYNGDMLESPFEQEFVGRYLREAGSEYLVQILEPQRPLSTVVVASDCVLCKDRRVDFATQIPYGETAHPGFIFEIDGAPYHSGIVNRLNDELRDRMIQKAGYITKRVKQQQDLHFLQNWDELDVTSGQYLSTIKKNYQKTLTGLWAETLQVVLAP